jgi:hypothetical protein
VVSASFDINLQWSVLHGWLFSDGHPSQNVKQANRRAQWSSWTTLGPKGLCKNSV